MSLLYNIFSNKVIRYAYIGWFVIALFYLYQYILRAFPGVMVDDIRLSFRITAEEFATLGSLTVVAYALCQIPFGILVDKIGIKKMCIYSIAMCLLGTITFCFTEVFRVAQVARFITGIGSASAFMCALKFIADHIPPGKRGFLMGATLALGTLGPLLVGNIGKLLDNKVGWRDTMMLSVIVGIFALLSIVIFIKNNKQDAITLLNKKSFRDTMKDVFIILKSKKIVIYSILAVGLYTPLSALADLWGTAFLKQKYCLSTNDAAQLVMVLYIGLTSGSLILPWLSEKFNLLNHFIVVCGFAVLGIFSLIIYLPGVHSNIDLIIMLFSLGFFCGAEMMCFTGALTGSNKYDSGEIIGVVNTLNMLGGALLQQLIGWGLDLQWDGVVDGNGIRQYSTEQFQTSLSILVCLIALCCIVSICLFKVKSQNKIAIK